MRSFTNAFGSWGRYSKRDALSSSSSALAAARPGERAQLMFVLTLACCGRPCSIYFAMPTKQFRTIRTIDA